MPYWVEQSYGPHVEDINQTVRRFKNGDITNVQAWHHLSNLYQKCSGKAAPVLLDTMDPSRVAYMIITWFPMYANLWFEGSRPECYATARRMSLSDEKYAVRYEY